MASFRDLLPAPPEPEAPDPPRRREIQGETVAEAVARGVRIQVIPVMRRDEPPSQRPPWGNDGFVAKRADGKRRTTAAEDAPL